MITRRISSFFGMTCLLIVCGSLSVRAQFRSAIEGSVSDATGAVIPGVEVILTNVDTGVAQKTAGSDKGDFRFSSLPPGNYRLTARKEGFVRVTQENVVLLASEVRTVPLMMKLGQVKTEITVTTAPPPVQMSEAKVASDISGDEVRALPLPGRNVLNMIMQTPGVTGIGMASGNAIDNDIFALVGNPSVNANGNRGSANGFFVDNAAVNSNPDPGVYNLTPNQESIQEFHVAVNDYSAEYGEHAGMIVQAVTRSGSNHFHGSLFEAHTDNAITSRNVFQNSATSNPDHVVPTFRHNEFGGSIGGPIQKDKTFFFVSWDQLRAASPFTASTNTETPELVNFMKTNLPNNLSTSLLTKYPVVIPRGTGTLTNVRTVAQEMANNYPASSPFSQCNGTGPLGMPCTMPLYGTTFYSVAPLNTGLQWNARGDRYWRDAKDRVYVNSYHKTQHSEPFRVRPEFAATVDPISTFVNLNWTHSISGTTINEAAVGFIRNGSGGACNHCEVPPIGAGALPGLGNGFSPAVFVQNDYHWRDLVSMTRGKHTLKAGADIFRDQENDLFSGSQQRPGYGFADVFDFANGGVVKQINGTPIPFAQQTTFTQGTINFDSRTGGPTFQDLGYRTTTYGFFGQDDWKVKSNLSVNLGLRWDFSSNPRETHGRLANIVMGSGSTFQERVANASILPTPDGALLTTHRIGYFAPRVGFAWDPTHKGKLSIRGGFGVFFDRWPNIVWSDATRFNPPYEAGFTATTNDPNGPQPIYGLCQLSQTPFNCPSPVPPHVGVNARGGPINALTGGVLKAGLGGVAPDLKYAYSENRFLGVQYAISPNWILEADYLGDLGIHLYTSINRNRFAGDRQLNGGVVTRLNSFFTGMNYTDNSGWSNYNGATFVLRKTPSHGYYYQVSYTIGKTLSLSDAPGPGRDSSVVADIADAYNIGAQRGLAAFDIPKDLSFNFVWEVPGHRFNDRWLNGLAHGWQLTGLGTIESGYPATVTSGGVGVVNDYNGDGSGPDRPNALAGNSIGNVSRSTYMTGALNKANFAIPTPGTEGTLGRNTFRGPGYANTNLSVIKNNHIPWFVGKEGARLQIRAEIYNLFNRVNLDSRTWDTGLISNTFGQVRGVFYPRTLQANLRIEF